MGLLGFTPQHDCGPGGVNDLHPSWSWAMMPDGSQRVYGLKYAPTATRAPASRAPAVDSERARLLAAEVRALTIPGQVRRTAERAAAFASDKLGLGALEVRYFRPSYIDAAAFFQPSTPDELWLASDTHAALAAGIVCHESRHAWQYASLAPDDPRLADTPAGENWREYDARQWADNAAGVLRRGY